MKQDIELCFEKHLEDGEYIVWCSPMSPSASLRQKGAFGGDFIGGAIFALAGFLPVFSVFSNDKADYVSKVIALGLFFAFVFSGIYCIVKNLLGTKSVYAVTNKRVLVKNAFKLKQMALNEISKMQIVTKADIGLLRMFHISQSPGSYHCYIIEFTALDSPEEAETAVRDQISALRNNGSTDDIDTLVNCWS